MVSSLASASLLWLPRPVLTRAMGRLLLVLWPVELMRLLFDVPRLTAVAGILFGVYLLMAFLVAGWGDRILATTLLLGTTGLVAIDGTWNLMIAGLETSLIFVAFLPAVYLLRSSMAGDVRLLAYRERIGAAPVDQQAGWMLVGSHILGSVLTVGTLAIMSPVVPVTADEETRRAGALATVCGVSLSILWSPVFVAMAVVSGVIPHVPLWKTILLGLSLATIGLLTALAVLGVRNKGQLAARAAGALRPIIPVVALTAATVVMVRAITPLSTLEVTSLALPLIAVMLLASQSRPTRRVAITTARQGLDVLGAEVFIVALAFALGSVMRTSPTMQHLVQGLLGPDLPAVALIAIIVAGMVVAGVAGVHPIVAASILLAIFIDADVPLADLTLSGAVLLGWACSAMIASVGLIIIVAAGMFQVPRRDMIFGRNMVLVLLFAMLGTLALTVLNAVIAS